MLTFEMWLTELNKLAEKSGAGTDYVDQTGEECWRVMYDDGYSPDEAWSQEMDAAQDCL